MIKDVVFIFVLVVAFISISGTSYSDTIPKERTSEQVLTEMVNNLRSQLTLSRQLQIIEARYGSLQKELDRIKAADETAKELKQDTCKGDCESAPVK